MVYVHWLTNIDHKANDIYLGSFKNLKSANAVCRYLVHFLCSMCEAFYFDTYDYVNRIYEHRYVEVHRDDVIRVYHKYSYGI